MQYVNFDLETSSYQNLQGVESFNVWVSKSPEGEQRPGEAERVTLKEWVRQRARLFSKRMLNVDEMIAMGEELGAALLPPKARSLFDRSFAHLAENEGLRIRLKLDSYALADLPWEYAYVSDPDTPPGQRGIEGFLVLDRRFNRHVSLVRYEALGRPPGKLATIGAEPLRMVAFMVNPRNEHQLDLSTEQQNIKTALKGIERIHTEFYMNATVDELIQAIFQGVHIFHFAGHGRFDGDLGSSYVSQEGSGFLALADENGNEVAFSADKLALNLAGRGVRLAFLGACETGRREQVNAWTGIAPALTRAGIPAVIGMQYKITDENAVVFSRSFYRTLVQGKPIDEAVTEGRLAIFTQSNNKDERDWGVPVLYLRAEDGTVLPAAGTTGALPSGPLHSASNAAENAGVDKRALRIAMTQAFSMEELEALCADVEQDLADHSHPIQVNLEMVGGASKAAKVLNLIEYLDRRGYLSHLVKAVRCARPNVI